MKKKKSGFTLVELLAVIVLLGIVITIATISVINVSKKIKESQRDNLFKSLEVAAKKYVSDTGLNKVYVQTLINEGLVEADGESKVIYDPVSKKSINCFYFDFSGSEPQLSESDVCDEQVLNDSLIGLKYCVIPSGQSICSPNKVFDSTWLNTDNILLGADLTKLNVSDTSSLKYKWITPLAPDVYDVNEYHKINISSGNYINDVYELAISYNEKEYKASARVKIDHTSPVVDSVSLQYPNVFKKSKIINAVVYDMESGLQAYAVTKSSSMPSTDEWKTISGKSKEITHEADSNGTYYIWVKDQAGNTNINSITSDIIIVSKIDNTAPSCTNGGDNSSWTRSSITIWWGCDDGSGENDSGCNINYSGGNKTFNTTTKKANINSYIIMDNAGNATTCPKRTASVYVDVTRPFVNNFVINSNKKYNSSSVYVDIKADDNDSGISQICLTEFNNSFSCNWQNAENGSYKTDYIFRSNEGSGASFTLYAFAKDIAGNISNLTSENYILYTLCAKKNVTGYGSYGDCSAGCGGGFKYRDVYYEDYYLGLPCPIGTNEDITSCNPEPCCSQGTYGYDSCNANGYEVNKRYNECLGKYEYQTTTKGCVSDYYDCSWSSCDNNGWKYKICKYKYKGQELINNNVEKRACSTGYYNCTEWSQCVNNVQYQTCDYNYGGMIYTDTTAKSQACSSKTICEYKGSELFGTYKGSHIGNYGSSVIPGNWGDWCEANGTTCNADIGYHRICIGDECGDAYGMTALQINQAYGCKFANYWCSCK